MRASPFPALLCLRHRSARLFIFGSHSTVLGAYSGFAPRNCSWWALVPYGVLGIKPGSAACKASALGPRPQQRSKPPGNNQVEQEQVRLLTLEQTLPTGFPRAAHTETARTDTAGTVLSATLCEELPEHRHQHRKTAHPTQLKTNGVGAGHISESTDRTLQSASWYCLLDSTLQ